MKKIVNPFSITALADELHICLSECSRWFEENSHHIVRGCAGIIVSLILFLLLLLVLRKIAVPLVARRKPSAKASVSAASRQNPSASALSNALLQTIIVSIKPHPQKRLHPTVTRLPS